MKIRKHTYQHTILAAEDRVLASAPVSADGGKFLGMSGTVKVVGAADRNIAQAVMTMLRANVVMYVEQGVGTDADELWDRMVPKDVLLSGTAGSDQIDTDILTGDEDITTFSEPGLPNPTVLAEGDQIWGTEVLRSSHIYTFADTSDGFKAGTPDTFIPNQVFRTDTRKQVQMGGPIPGYALLAIGTPLLTSTSAAIPDLLINNEMLMLKHLHQLLEDSWKQFAGLDEAGAESPFIDIAALIVELTEPLVQEESGGAWAAGSFNVWNETYIDTYVPYNSVVPRTLGAG